MPPNESKRQKRLREKAEVEAKERTRLKAEAEKPKGLRRFMRWLATDYNWLKTFIGPLVAAFLFFLKAQTDKQKQTDKELSGNLVGPYVGPSAGYGNGDTSRLKNVSDSGKETFSQSIFSLPPKTKKGPNVEGVLIDKYDNPEFVKTGGVSIRIGNTFKSIAASFLFQPIDVLPLRGSGCALSKPLMIGVKGNRLYVSVSFDDLESNKPIGKMEYNHFSLWDDDRLDYDFDKKTQRKFEVRDYKGYIALSVEYFYNPDPTQANVYIAGYLVDNDQIQIMNTGRPSVGNYLPASFDTCIKKNDRNAIAIAEDKIGGINSIFGHPNLKKHKK